MASKYSRSIFIDSETNRNVDVTSCGIFLPSQDFTVASNEEMKFILTTFEMRLNFYYINATNNTFYLYDPAGPTYTPIVIAPGSYSSFAELSTAIQNACITAGFAGSTCSYTSTSRFLTITLGGAVPANSYFVSFQVPPSAGYLTPPLVSQTGFYNDSSEILGGTPTTNQNWTNVGAPPNMFGTQLATSPVNSIYPAQLNSMEAIFIRTNLQSTNYSTFAYAQESKANAITSSNIFARIPLAQGYYTDLNPFLTFEDQNGTGIFALSIGNKQIDQITFWLTDDKGRYLQQVRAGQVTSGNLSWKMTIKWEVFDKVEQNPYIPTLSDLSYKFQVNNGMRGI
jgi:hypothetical protein